MPEDYSLLHVVFFSYFNSWTDLAIDFSLCFRIRYPCWLLGPVGGTCALQYVCIKNKQKEATNIIVANKL